MTFEIVIHEFAKMIAEGKRIKKERLLEQEQASYQRDVTETFENHSNEDLKALWRKNEAAEFSLDEVDGYCIYKIMAALERRGEGDICRI